MSIAQHIMDHARAIYAGQELDKFKNITTQKNNKLEETDKTHHFKFSLDRAQLIAQGYDTTEKIDAKMLDFFNDLKNLQYEYTESKGYTKSGRERLRTNTVDLSNALIAYHDSGFQHKTDIPELAAGGTFISKSIGTLDTEPHFHIRFANDDKDRGKDFVNARNAIAELAKKHGITTHFMEQNIGRENTQNQDKLSRFSWTLQKATDFDIRQFVREKTKLTEKLDLLYKEAQNSGQLQYYIKTINHLQTRLKSQNLSFEWRGHNIVETYPLAVSKKDLAAIQTLQNGTNQEIQELLNDRGSKVARAYLEHSAGFKNHVIAEFEKRGFEFQKIDLKKLDLSNAQKPILKEYFAKDRSTAEAQKALRAEKITRETEPINLKTAFALDLYETLKTARNEKELKEHLELKGYKDVSFKTSGKSRIGLKFSDGKNRSTLLFREIDLVAWPEIRKIIEANEKAEIAVMPTTSSARERIQKNVEKAKQEFAYIDIYSADSVVDEALKLESKAKIAELKKAKDELENAKQAVVQEVLEERAKNIDTPETRAAIREYAIKQMTQDKPGAFFLTGEGGAGKSYTTRQVIEIEEANGRKVAKLGSTGIAACNIGGETLHSFFGIGISQNLKELQEFEAKNPDIKNKVINSLQNTDTIIIDEISMAHKNQMDLIEHRLKEANWQGKLIFVGDFLQIPPVHNGAEHEAKFAFESNLWKSANTETINLFGNMRVKAGSEDAAEFTEVLNRVRYGDASEETLDYLAKFKDTDINEAEATHIFATNREVKTYNELRLESVDGEAIEIKNSIKTGVKLTKVEREELYEEVPIDESLKLKVGAEVMLLSNDKKNDVYNGDRAVVEAIENGKIKVKMERTGEIKEIAKKDFEVEFERKDGEMVKAKINGYPMRLSYAITAHKSQGLSLKNVVAYSNNIFENAQFYVAISRATDPKTLKIKFDDKEQLRKAIKAETQSLKFMHCTLDTSKVEIAELSFKNLIKKANKSVGIELTTTEERKIGRINDNLNATRQELAKLAQDTASKFGSIAAHIRDAYSSAAEAIHERLNRVRSSQARQDREHDFVAEIVQPLEAQREATKAGTYGVDGAKRDIANGNAKTRVHSGTDRDKVRSSDTVIQRPQKELDKALKEVQKQNQKQNQREWTR